MPPGQPDTEPESPYKFLNYYRFRDRELFFGRKAETRILLSDVVMARLVVLFAKTGTGKTSLINAGVRPLLEERNYATFFIRVKKDPVASAITEISKPEHRERWKKELYWEGKTFAEQLEGIARQLAVPIVLFFDQFEEFFIYPLDDEHANKEEQAARRRGFVADIAAVYHNPLSRVHFVFSMREDWFVEMDIFRDEIPKIFHNDSNLRLRWFNCDQAREAIKLPAAEYGVTIEDAVVNRLISDLALNGDIEPAQLQIICDTLWRKTKGDRIELDHYLALGDEGSSEKIATQVLFKRFEEEFEKINDEDQLRILYALLPKLQTPQKTKYVRDIPALLKDLTNDDPALREIVEDDAERQDLIARLNRNGEPLEGLIKTLENDVGLVRTYVRDKQRVVELSHDYLVDSLSDLQKRVRAIEPQRRLAEAMAVYEKTGEPINVETLEKISDNASILRLQSRQAEALFLSALAYGVHIKLWFDRLNRETSWGILEEKIRDIDEAEYVINFLSELGTEDAFDLLEGVLSDDRVALYAVEVVGRRETTAVVEFLEKALSYKSLSPKALECLTRIRRSKRNEKVARRAQSVLEKEEGRKNRVLDEERIALGERPGSLSSVNSEPSRVLDDVDFAESDLGPHYSAVANAMSDGRVVPFLGAGVNLLGHQDKAWEPGERFLPSGYEFGRFLAQKFGYPAPDNAYPPDVARISQYICATHGWGPLYAELRAVFHMDYIPTVLHRFIASPIDSSHEETGLPFTQLIVTTNYDDVMERALLEASVPFEVVSYIALGESKGKFRRQRSGEASRTINNPNEYRLPEKGPVVLKLSGSVDRNDSLHDSFVITEDDYIDQISFLDSYRSIPVAIRAKLQRSHVLFLGHSLRDWNVRVILRRIWGEQPRHYRSWAIQWKPDPVDRELWSERAVEIHSVQLADYIHALKEQINQKLRGAK